MKGNHMRITMVTTAEQQEAVDKAEIVANLLTGRFDTAALAEFAAEDNPAIGYSKYRLLNVWGAGEDSGETFNTREQLWCVTGPTAGLSADDVARIQTVIRQGGEMDPNIFGAGELADAVWEFDIAAVLGLVQNQQVARLVESIKRRELSESDLDDLLSTVAASPDGSPAEIPDEVYDGGVVEAARFLVQRIGFTEAAAAVQIHHADI